MDETPPERPADAQDDAAATRAASRTATRALWMRRGRHAARWLGLLAVCYLGGVTATSLAPTTVETEVYKATLRISPLLHRTPTLHSPTILGDIDLRFRAPVLAPSIDANVQIKADIANVVGKKDLSVDALKPSNKAIDEALRGALVDVGLKFTAGAAAAALLTSGVLAYGRRTRPTRRHLVLTATAAGSAVALTAGGMATAYQPSRFETFRSTGVLGELQRNAGILGDVSDRANQASPYVRNLIALSESLQDKFTPEEANKPATVRALVVSDLHGANYYPLMRSIVVDQKIDLVIDAGDLVNFGAVQEADAAKMVQGIESLGVPYVFVRGNHDATSATDTALLRRLAKAKNVVLLQPASGDYTELNFRGLRIAGFNDSRYFGDNNPSQDASQTPLAEAFDRAFEGRQEPDVVVTHEPVAAEKVGTGAIRINGHMHSSGLEGRRIQAGTFTGGGVLSHFVQPKDRKDGELTGQPYAFDVLSFAQDCHLTTLMRYQFTGIVEGRPVYDNVQVINGSTISSTVPTAGGDGSGGMPSGSPTGAASPAATPTPTPGATGEAAAGPAARACLPAGAPGATVSTETVPRKPVR